jgi:hypothetical protein
VEVVGLATLLQDFQAPEDKAPDLDRSKVLGEKQTQRQGDSRDRDTKGKDEERETHSKSQGSVAQARGLTNTLIFTHSHTTLTLTHTSTGCAHRHSHHTRSLTGHTYIPVDSLSHRPSKTTHTLFHTHSHSAT